MKKRMVIIILTILALVTMIGIMMFMVTSTDDADAVLENFINNSSTLRRPITVNEIARQIREEEDIKPNPSVFPPINDTGSNVTNKDWLSILDKVHKDWGMYGLYYVQDIRGFVDSSGKSIKVRPDCSGYIGYALHIMGISKETTCGNSASLPSFLVSAGMEKIPLSDVTGGKLKAGDILFYSGHVEAFKEYSDTNYPIVWNWGGAASAQNKYAGVTDVSTVNSTGRSGHPLSSVIDAYRLRVTKTPGQGE